MIQDYKLGPEMTITVDEPPQPWQCKLIFTPGTKPSGILTTKPRRCLAHRAPGSELCTAHKRSKLPILCPVGHDAPPDRMNATAEQVRCRGCGEMQEIEKRGGDTEFYCHEGRCPRCGEWVVCVKSCPCEAP